MLRVVFIDLYDLMVVATGDEDLRIMARASAVFGNLQEFQPDSEIITAYLERTKIYFTANDVADEKKVAVSLTVIGPKIFALLRSLTTPELPQDKSFEELERCSRYISNRSR